MDPRVTQLHSRAESLAVQFKEGRGANHIDEAIALDREALELCAPGHPLRLGCLTWLAKHLGNRHWKPESLVDIEEAIVLDREALAIPPPGHPDRLIPLHNLAVHLAARYTRLGRTEDLDEAIILHREARAFRPSRYPDQSLYLGSLADHLSLRYNQLGRKEDLNETIVLGRDVLAFYPPGHPRRWLSLISLADDLFTRYKELEAMEDLDEAILVARDSLPLWAPGHPNRSQSLNRLTSYLRARYTKSSQLTDKEEIFSLFAQLVHVDQMVSFTDLSVVDTWIVAAEEFEHPTTFLAYDTYLRLVIHDLATLPPTSQKLFTMRNFMLLVASDTFSAFIRRCFPVRAVELLEQGRDVLWSQLSCVHSPLDGVRASGSAGKRLADEFAELTSLIRNALESSAADLRGWLYDLKDDLQKVVTDIRDLPGLSRFLLPPLFSNLQQAACEGPVILVNASLYGCDALIILADRDPVHIRMSMTSERVRGLSLTLRSLISCAKTMNTTRDIAIVLRELWDEVVSPIVDVLLTKYPRRSRIWWCPTAEFSLLPLHAAGPYRNGQQNLVDLYISSYTPTLTALIRARARDDPSSPAAEPKAFVAIGQGKVVGESELPSVGTELACIGQRVHGLATFTSIEGSESCISKVTEGLGQAQWVHLACHGLPNPKQPFESSFVLHDGQLTIKRLIECKMENPQFAFLSACHTTVGHEYEGGPDQMIHLASAMQFAGFQSVVGTMWAADDAQTNEITDTFYRHMVDESGRLDHTRAAFALHETMKELEDIPLDQRISYMHVGA